MPYNVNFDWILDNSRFGREVYFDLCQKSMMKLLCKNSKWLKEVNALNINHTRHTQAICWQQSTNFLSVFEHFVGLVLNTMCRSDPS